MSKAEQRGVRAHCQPQTMKGYRETNPIWCNLHAGTELTDEFGVLRGGYSVSLSWEDPRQFIWRVDQIARLVRCHACGVAPLVGAILFVVSCQS